MILEIALGIVLAIVILALLPQILAFGAIALALALVLAVVAAIAFWLFPSWESFLIVVVILALAYTVIAIIGDRPRFYENEAK